MEKKHPGWDLGWALWRHSKLRTPCCGQKVQRLGWLRYNLLDLPAENHRLQAVRAASVETGQSGHISSLCILQIIKELWCIWTIDLQVEFWARSFSRDKRCRIWLRQQCFHCWCCCHDSCRRSGCFYPKKGPCIQSRVLSSIEFSSFWQL